MTGTLRIASASTKQLLRSSEVITTMVVFPAALLVILALFSDLKWESSAGAVPLIDFWVTGMGVLAVALGNGHAFLATIANYKAGGVLKRLSVTPVSPAQLILGEVIPRTAMVMVTVTGLSVAFVIAGLTRTPQSANALDSSASFPLYLFTGAMFPLAAFPGWLEQAARFIPYTGLIAAVRGIAIQGRSLTDFGPELAIAAAWMVLLFVGAARAYRFVT